MCRTSQRRLGTTKESTAVLEQPRQLHRSLTGKSFSLDQLSTSLDDMSLNDMTKLQELISAKRAQLESTKAVVLDSAQELKNEEDARIAEQKEEVKQNIVSILEGYTPEGIQKKGLRGKRTPLLKLAEELMIDLGKKYKKIPALQGSILKVLNDLLDDDQLDLIPSVVMD